MARIVARAVGGRVGGHAGVLDDVAAQRLGFVRRLQLFQRLIHVALPGDLDELQQVIFDGRPLERIALRESESPISSCSVPNTNGSTWASNRTEASGDSSGCFPICNPAAKNASATTPLLRRLVHERPQNSQFGNSRIAPYNAEISLQISRFERIGVRLAKPLAERAGLFIQLELNAQPLGDAAQKFRQIAAGVVRKRLRPFAIGPANAARQLAVLPSPNAPPRPTAYTP